MTPKAFRTYIINILRKASYRWGPRYRVKKKAQLAYGRYKCASCEKSFGPKEINVDHIEPVVDPTTGFVSWDNYIERLFVGEAGLQVLCKVCHKAKTLAENRGR